MRDYVLDIVRRYIDEKIKRAGDGNVLVRCPFHKSGAERRPSFSVHLEEGLFHCFTCHAAGTIPTLLRMLGLPSDQIDAEVGPIKDALKRNLEIRKHKEASRFIHQDPFRAHTILTEAIIDSFNWCPIPLTQAGFSWQWLQYLQIGVDRINQRITYPVRDIYGNLAGFVGGATMAGQHPKYKVYKGRRKDEEGNVIPSDYGPWFDEDYPNYQFDNHDYLWNFDKVYPRIFFGKEGKEQPSLILVEGFKACIWLLQHGYQNTVALMGSYLSRKQLQLILRLNVKIILFLDNDQPGQEATQRVGNFLLRSTPAVWVAHYEQNQEGFQPDWLDALSLRRAIEGSTWYPHRFRRH